MLYTIVFAMIFSGIVINKKDTNALFMYSWKKWGYRWAWELSVAFKKQAFPKSASSAGRWGDEGMKCAIGPQYPSENNVTLPLPCPPHLGVLHEAHHNVLLCLAPELRIFS